MCQSLIHIALHQNTRPVFCLYVAQSVDGAEEFELHTVNIFFSSCSFWKRIKTYYTYYSTVVHQSLWLCELLFALVTMSDHYCDTCVDTFGSKKQTNKKKHGRDASVENHSMCAEKETAVNCKWPRWLFSSQPLRQWLLSCLFPLQDIDTPHVLFQIISKVKKKLFQTLTSALCFSQTFEVIYLTFLSYLCLYCFFHCPHPFFCFPSASLAASLPSTSFI